MLRFVSAIQVCQSASGMHSSNDTVHGVLRAFLSLSEKPLRYSNYVNCVGSFIEDSIDAIELQSIRAETKKLAKESISSISSLFLWPFGDRHINEFVQNF
jgi:hypothetical protein